MHTHAHTTVKQSLTAQIERLVQASFNTALTPDISFVSVIIHSGFAASESCQTPLFSTPRITPHCDYCQSLFRPGHEHLSLDLGQDLDQRAPRKGSCRQGNRSKGSRTNCRHKIPFREVSASSHPQLTTGNILLVSAWKKKSARCLASALESTFRTVSFLKVSVTERT